MWEGEEGVGGGGGCGRGRRVWEGEEGVGGGGGCGRGRRVWEECVGGGAGWGKEEEADLKAQRTPAMEHDGVPDHSACRLVMRCDAYPRTSTGLSH